MKIIIYDGVGSYDTGVYLGANKSKKNPIYVGTPKQVKIKKAVNESNSFDIVISNDSSLLEKIKPNNLYYIEIYKDSKLVTFGIAIEVEVEYEKEEINITCNDIFYILNYLPSYPWAAHNRKNLLGMLWSLLYFATDGLNRYEGYTERVDVGNDYYLIPSRFSTMLKTLRATSVDMRDQNDAFSQFSLLVDSYKKNYYRQIKEVAIKTYEYGELDYTITPGFLFEFGDLKRDIEEESLKVLFTSGLKTKTKKINLEPSIGTILPFGGVYRAAENERKKPSDITLATKELQDENYIGQNLEGKRVIKAKDTSKNFYKTNLLYLTEIIPLAEEDSIPIKKELKHVGEVLFERTIAEIETTQTPSEFSVEIETDDIDYIAGSQIQLLNDVNSEEYYKYFTDIEGVYYIKEHEIEYDSGSYKQSFVLTDRNNFNYDQDATATMKRIKRILKKDGEYVKSAKPKYKVGVFEGTVTEDSTVTIEKFYSEDENVNHYTYSLDKQPDSNDHWGLLVIDFKDREEIEQEFVKIYNDPNIRSYLYNSYIYNSVTTSKNGEVATLSYPPSVIGPTVIEFTGITKPLKYAVAIFYEIVKDDDDDDILVDIRKYDDQGVPDPNPLIFNCSVADYVAEKILQNNIIDPLDDFNNYILWSPTAPREDWAFSWQPANTRYLIGNVLNLVEFLDDKDVAQIITDLSDPTVLEKMKTHLLAVLDEQEDAVFSRRTVKSWFRLIADDVTIVDDARKTIKKVMNSFALSVYRVYAYKAKDNGCGTEWTYRIIPDVQEELDYFGEVVIGNASTGGGLGAVEVGNCTTAEYIFDMKSSRVVDKITYYGLASYGQARVWVYYNNGGTWVNLSSYYLNQHGDVLYTSFTTPVSTDKFKIAIYDTNCGGYGKIANISNVYMHSRDKKLIGPSGELLGTDV